MDAMESSLSYDVHGPLRRGGGGGGAPIVVPLGFMLIVLAVCSTVASKMRCNMLVALIIGVIAGGTGISKELKPFELDPAIKSLAKPLVDSLVEIGIMLTLFFSGLALDTGKEMFSTTSPFSQYKRIILVMGLGQIATSWGMFSLVGFGSGLCVTPPAVLYFGLVCTLSSGLLMHGAIDAGMDATLHGKPPLYLTGCMN